MTRTALTDDTGKWFDMDKAEDFDEKTFWDGNNNISMATNSQTEHEILYRTKSNRWILHTWSQWQESRESYNEITDTEAAEWLMKNEYENENIPKDLLELLANDIKDLEL